MRGFSAPHLSLKAILNRQKTITQKWKLNNEDPLMLKPPKIGRRLGEMGPESRPSRAPIH